MGSIMEMTPLGHAAGKGFKGMVELLINSGANVNYLCSVKEEGSNVSVTNDSVSLIGYNATTCILNTW